MCDRVFDDKSRQIVVPHICFRLPNVFATGQHCALILHFYNSDVVETDIPE